MIYIAHCSSSECDWVGETDDFVQSCPKCGAPVTIDDLKDTTSDG